MVAQQTLTLFVMVRIHAGQPMINNNLRIQKTTENGLANAFATSQQRFLNPHHYHHSISSPAPGDQESGARSKNNSAIAMAHSPAVEYSKNTRPSSS